MRFALLRGPLRHVLIAASALACSGDAPCVFYPCPQFEAATIAVSAANAPAGITGLTMAISGAVTGSGPCVQGPVSTCHVLGGTGTYHVQLTAPGYIPVEVVFTITGTDAGCNTCGKLDRQQLTVTLQPVS